MSQLYFKIKSTFCYISFRFNFEFKIYSKREKNLYIEYIWDMQMNEARVTFVKKDAWK